MLTTLGEGGINMKLKKSEKLSLIIIAVVISVSILVLLNRGDLENIDSSSNGHIVAKVNGEIINLDELNIRYNLFRNSMNKIQFLNDVVIPNKLLLQEAKKKGITISSVEIEIAFNKLLQEKKISKEEFMDVIKEQEISKKETDQLIGEQVIIAKLVKQIVPELTISSKESNNFYQKNLDAFTNNKGVMQFEEVNGKIKKMLLKIKRETKVREYVIDLAEKGNVVMYDLLFLK